MVKTILRLEGLAIFCASLYFYLVYDGNWIVFALLLFVPDISMVGYLRDKKIGSYIYNLVHNLALAILLILIGKILDFENLFYVGLILSAHVGVDRLSGFGLKYEKDFKETHMQKV